MNQLINAFKAPFNDLSAVPASDKPTNGQIALVWAVIGVVVAKAV